MGTIERGVVKAKNDCLQGQTLDDIPSAVLEDAAQLVKANSINGNKMNDLEIVYTMWSNLKKSPSMEVGQVSFHREKEVRKLRVAKRSNDIVNRLNKTKTEAHPGNKIVWDGRRFLILFLVFGRFQIRTGKS